MMKLEEEWSVPVVGTKELDMFMFKDIQIKRSKELAKMGREVIIIAAIKNSIATLVISNCKYFISY